MVAIQEMGGTTIVQNPKDSQIDTMTQGTSNVMGPDFVLNQKEIASKLIELLK